MRLDDLYKMTAFIYQDANLSRSREATFLHFVEVCGMLTSMDRKKKKVNINVPDALCKALGWYFPFMAKMGVKSVEDLIFTKYPSVCPYCRTQPHDVVQCKLMKGADATVSHDEVTALSKANHSKMPASLNGWMKMFNDIYPRTPHAESGFSTVALLEELGELAEATRVFDRFPHYFFGEAADVFSYIMGLANEYALTLDDDDPVFDFDAEYLSRYPGLCINCGSRSCMCPPVPQGTIGRMAKEMPINVDEFQISDREAFSLQGSVVAQSAFENASSHAAIARRLPYDRGELNSALTQLGYRLANAVEGSAPDVANQLRSQALTIGGSRVKRGEVANKEEPLSLLTTLKKAWLLTGTEVQKELREGGGQLGELTHIFDKKILVVTANSDGEGEKALRLDFEVKAIRMAFEMSVAKDNVQVIHLTAATIDEFRRKLLNDQFDIIHFAGHADEDGLSFLDAGGKEAVLDYAALARMVRSQDRLECVLLNACHSISTVNEAFAPLVIGMMYEIDDEPAIAFTTGFYDAIAARKDAASAFDEGGLSMVTKGFSPDVVAKLTLEVKH